MGRRNEYQPNDSDALRLNSKGRYGSCVDGRSLCDPLVTHEPYLSTLEMLRNKTLYTLTFTLLTLLCYVTVQIAGVMPRHIIIIIIIIIIIKR